MTRQQNIYFTTSNNHYTTTLFPTQRRIRFLPCILRFKTEYTTVTLVDRSDSRHPNCLLGSNIDDTAAKYTFCIFPGKRMLAVVEAVATHWCYFDSYHAL